jgi:hypothetical protein
MALRALLAITLDTSRTVVPIGQPNGAGNYVLPLPLEQLPPPPVTDSGQRCATGEWVRALGGADAGETSFVAYVEGLADRTVILDAVDVRLVGKSPPVVGTTSRSRACARPGGA